MVDKLEDKATIDEAIGEILDETVDIEKENDVSLDEDIITTPNTSDNVETNCLALTVRKDYNLIIVKNIFTASGRISWKVLISTAIINFLNLIF